MLIWLHQDETSKWIQKDFKKTSKRLQRDFGPIVEDGRAVLHWVGWKLDVVVTFTKDLDLNAAWSSFHWDTNCLTLLISAAAKSQQEWLAKKIGSFFFLTGRVHNEVTLFLNKNCHFFYSSVSHETRSKGLSKDVAFGNLLLIWHIWNMCRDAGWLKVSLSQNEYLKSLIFKNSNWKIWRISALKDYSD